AASGSRRPRCAGRCWGWGTRSQAWRWGMWCAWRCATFRAATLRPTQALLQQRPLGAAEHEHFRQLVSLVERGGAAPAAVAARRARFENERALAAQAPMSLGQGVV